MNETIDVRLSKIIDELLRGDIPLQMAMEQIEAKYIASALRVTGGNVTRASRKLGVHRNTLHFKLRSIGLSNTFRAKPRYRAQRRGAR